MLKMPFFNTDRVAVIRIFSFIFCFFVFGLVFSTSVNAAGTDDFVITIKTDNAGTSGSTSFTIPVSGTYNYSVDWDNDGSVDQSGITGSVTHNYGVAGTYTLRISGVFPTILFNNGGDKLKILSVEQWGTISWQTLANSFYGCSNLVINATDNPDLSLVTDASAAFRGASSINTGLENWNVSSVTNMSSMFSGATNFNSDISSWNVGSVINMASMFFQASSFNQNIGGWNVSSVTNMQSMFYFASSFNQNLNSWNVSNVTTMSGMFFSASSFNGLIGNWNVGSVTNMQSMFYGTTVFNQSLNSWDVSGVLNMKSMFSSSGFNGDISAWNVSSVTDMGWMFRNNSAFNQNIGGWNTISVTKMDFMFYNASSFNQNLNSWNVSNVTTMREMFSGASSFNGQIGSWNVASVTHMGSMFFNASAFNQDISTWNTANVTIMWEMFSGATSFDQDISAWNVSSATDMWHMFTGATSFNQDLSSWNIGSVLYMENIFDGTGLSTQNYDSILIGWNGLVSKQTFVELGAINTNYCSNSATSARGDLISSNSWTILDAGHECPYIINLGGGLDTETVSGGDSLETGDYETFATVSTRLKTTTGTVLADIDVDLYVNQDWSSVTADTDLVNGKAFVHNLTSAPGSAASFTLYVPRVGGANSAFVCPGASSLAALNTSCVGGYYASIGDVGVSLVTISSQEYIAISGLTGTGAFITATVPNSTYIDLDPQPATLPNIISTAPEVAVSTSDLFYMSYIPSTTEFGIGDYVDIAIPADWSSLAVCAATGDADGAGGNDHTVSVVDSQIIRFTFTAATTTALSTGVEFCFSATTAPTAGNYNIPISDTNDGDYSTALVYVGDANDVLVSASVPITLTLRIKEPSTALDTNSCNLGVLNPGAINSCSYRIAAGTNAGNGLQIYVLTDGDLDSGANTIDPVADDDVTVGFEEYGVVVTPGTGFTVSASFSTTLDKPVPTVPVLLVNAAGSVDDSIATNWTTVTHYASINAGTVQGSYNQNVTYRVFAGT